MLDWMETFYNKSIMPYHLSSKSKAGHLVCLEYKGNFDSVGKMEELNNWCDIHSGTAGVDWSATVFSNSFDTIINYVFANDSHAALFRLTFE